MQSSTPMIQDGQLHALILTEKRATHMGTDLQNIHSIGEVVEGIPVMLVHLHKAYTLECVQYATWTYDFVILITTCFCDFTSTFGCKSQIITTWVWPVSNPSHSVQKKAIWFLNQQFYYGRHLQCSNTYYYLDQNNITTQFYYLS
jgi:hypothetical protein